MSQKNELTINVYDKAGKTVKTVSAKTIDLEFGTIRSIMRILNVENIDNTAELLNTLYGAWDEVTGVLEQCLPEMKDEDWDHVKLKELMPVVIGILKYSFAEILTIPQDPKN